MRMILKLFALPVLLLVIILGLLGKAATNVSSYVLGLLLLVIAGCGIYCIVQAQWTSLAILAGMAVAVFLALFFLAWLLFTLEDIRERLGSFIQS